MPSAELERLVSINVIEREAPIRAELEGLVRRCRRDARRFAEPKPLARGRFRLAYGAVHSIALAALRWHGYRPRNRQIVFQATQLNVPTIAREGFLRIAY